VINAVVSQQRKAMLLGAPRVIAYVDPRAPGLYTVDGFFSCLACSWLWFVIFPLCFCRYNLAVKAAGDGAVVNMAFFGDIAKDLIGKPADVLVAESSGTSSVLPLEIWTL
jgi:hypothetical protein